jgi:Putative metal-binding motif
VAAHRSLLLLGVLAASLLPAGVASGAAGADNYDNAPELLFSVPGTVGDNVSYTVQGGEPVTGCGSTAMTRTAWWRFIGTGQAIRITTQASNFDTVLAVYDAPAGTPILGNRVMCNDDDPAGGSTSALEFTSTRGKSYLVQVGSFGSDSGKIDVRASSPTRPGNDDRISARVLHTAVPATVSNAGASQERAERLRCGTTGYAATMWFSWTAPGVGDAAFSSSAAFGDTVVTVYRASDGAAVGCNAGSIARVPLRVSPGGYLIQVGSKGSNVAGLGVGPVATKVDFTLDPDLDNDGELASTDCNDRAPTIRHGVVEVPDDGIDQNCDGLDAVDLDRDDDGENRPDDCDDANPAINHRARDIPGNRINEDCRGGDATFPALGARVSGVWKAFRGYTQFISLAVTRSPGRVKVRITCDGRGCPFKAKKRKIRKATSRFSLFSLVKGAKLRRGAKLQVRVTRPGHVGVVTTWRIRSPATPKRVDRCLVPGRQRPSRC